MNGRNTLLTYVNILLIVILVFLCRKLYLVPGKENIEYKDLITILLTAIAVLLAAVTIIVALLAVWGYNSIRDAAASAAEKAAQATAASVAREIAEPVATRVAETAVQTLGRVAQSDETEEIVAALTSRDGNNDGGSRP